MSRPKNRASRAPALAQPVRVRDGFANFNAKLGVGSPLGQSVYLQNFITRNYLQLESMYRTNWLASLAIDAVAEDMTKQGIDIQGVDDDARTVQTYLTSRGIWNTLTDAIRWGRLYGGAIAYIEIDGQDPSAELRPETISRDKFIGLRSFDRWQLDPSLSNIVSGGPYDGLPEYYDVLADPSLGIQAMRIHHTRAVRFVGNKLPWRQALIENLWGASVIERLLDRLNDFNMTSASTAQLVTRAQLRTMKIQKLREVFAQGGKAEENMLKMFSHMSAMQSSMGISLIDADDEFEATPYTFTGLDEVLLSQAQQLSGALQIPLVRLFGQSPAGLNATGDSDWQNYASGILARQEADLRQGLHSILECAYRSATGKAIPEEFNFSFMPLLAVSASEKATIATQITDVIVKAHGEGLIPTQSAMTELRNSAEVTGIFSTITDEAIADAEELPEPPQPEMIPNGNEEDPTDQAEVPNEAE